MEFLNRPCSFTEERQDIFNLANTIKLLKYPTKELHRHLADYLAMCAEYHYRWAETMEEKTVNQPQQLDIPGVSR